MANMKMMLVLLGLVAVACAAPQFTPSKPASVGSAAVDSQGPSDEDDFSASGAKPASSFGGSSSFSSPPKSPSSLGGSGDLSGSASEAFEFRANPSPISGADAATSTSVSSSVSSSGSPSASGSAAGLKPTSVFKGSDDSTEDEDVTSAPRSTGFFSG